MKTTNLTEKGEMHEKSINMNTAYNSRKENFSESQHQPTKSYVHTSE
jgi:hypothetical protein